MAMAALTKLENVKNYLGINNGNDDVLLTRLIESASEFIATWTSREFGIANHTDWFDGNGNAVWMTRNYPITDVTAVSVGGIDIPKSTGVNVRGFAFDDTKIVLRGYTFAVGKLNCSASYSVDNSVHPDIEQACIELVANRYKEKDRIGLVSKGLAGETTAYTQADMSKSVRAILMNYRKVVPN